MDVFAPHQITALTMCISSSISVATANANKIPCNKVLTAPVSAFKCTRLVLWNSPQSAVAD